jgi:hypothetical protein
MATKDPILSKKDLNKRERDEYSVVTVKVSNKVSRRASCGCHRIGRSGVMVRLQSQRLMTNRFLVIFVI